MVYHSSVKDYYKEMKNENVFFKAFEHVNHQFFNLSGDLVNIFNMETPVTLITDIKQYPGLNPYGRTISLAYINESIRVDLESGISLACLYILFYLTLIFVSDQNTLI